jgi:HAD superfamily hydrolase (TIGR01509 family)
VVPVAGARGVLLDVDGTLLDSVDAHTRAWLAALREAGIEVPYERMRRLIGMGGDRILPLVAGVPADSSLGETVSKRRAAIFLSDEAPRVRPTRGARSLLDAIRAWGGAVAIATSAKPDELRALLGVLDATDLIARAASADEVEGSKPAPDVIHAALATVDLAPGDVVFVGDTGYDIEAAANAGVATIALRSGGWTDADLAGAIAVYADPADLLAHASETPLAGIAARRATAGARPD